MFFEQVGKIFAETFGWEINGQGDRSPLVPFRQTGIDNHNPIVPSFLQEFDQFQFSQSFNPRRCSDRLDTKRRTSARSFVKRRLDGMQRILLALNHNGPGRGFDFDSLDTFGNAY